MSRWLNIRSTVFIGTILALTGSLSCQNKTSPPGTIQIVTTIPPLTAFAEQIGGDHVRVMTMVPPGASPHTYEPTPHQMKQLSSAVLYIKVGTPIEFELTWLDKLLALNNTIQVCDASHSIDFMYQNQGNEYIDPHIWLSVKNARIMVDNIYQALASMDQEHEVDYKKNAAAYAARLDSLDAMISRMLREKQNRTLIVYHSAWNYFARDYELEQKTIEAGGKKPSAQTIQRIIETAQSLDIHVVFASPQFNRRFAERIAHEIDGEIVLIDPMAKKYIENMKRVASALARHLE